MQQIPDADKHSAQEHRSRRSAIRESHMSTIVSYKHKSVLCLVVAGNSKERRRLFTAAMTRRLHVTKYCNLIGRPHFSGHNRNMKTVGTVPGHHLRNREAWPGDEAKRAMGPSFAAYESMT